MRALIPTRGRSALIAATLAYAAITVAVFHNLLPSMATALYSGIDDPLLNTSILAWNAKHVPLTAAWWNFPDYAPLSGVTAWGDHLLVAYPLTSPLVWGTGNPVIAYNTLLLICFVMNGVAMFMLAREVTGSAAAAFVGGLAFAFAPYQAGQVAHVQMLIAFGMPLALFGLHRFMAGSPRAGLMWFTCGSLAVAFANGYILMFFPLLALLWFVWFARTRWQPLLPLAGAAIAVAVAAAPLLWGYHVRQRAYGLSRNYDEIKVFGAPLVTLGAVAHQNLVWRNVLTTTQIESSLFPGLAIVVLSGIGVAAHARRAWQRRDAIAFYAIGALIMWSIALGPEPSWNGVSRVPYGPYRLLLLVPGVNAIRVPARAWLVAVLCLAVTAAAGAELLLRRRRTRWLAVVLSAVVLAEGAFADTIVRVPAVVPRDLIPAGALVLDLPIGAVSDNMPAVYSAVMNGYRTINGYSGYGPPHLPVLREALAAHQPVAFDALRRLDDLYVVVRPELEAPFLRWMTAQPDLARLFESRMWTVYKLPHFGGVPRAHLPLALPVAGAPAFMIR
jgi:hypothetical protein